MSEFAFFRFRSNNMLTQEEEEHKEEIIQLTEEVLQAKGMKCDVGISITEGELKRKPLLKCHYCKLQYHSTDERKNMS